MNPNIDFDMACLAALSPPIHILPNTTPLGSYNPQPEILEPLHTPYYEHRGDLKCCSDKSPKSQKIQKSKNKKRTKRSRKNTELTEMMEKEKDGGNKVRAGCMCRAEKHFDNVIFELILKRFSGHSLYLHSF